MLNPIITIEDFSGENSLNQRLASKTQTFRSFGMDNYSRKGFLAVGNGNELVTGATASKYASDILFAVGDSNTYFAIDTKLFTLTTPTSISSVRTSSQSGIIQSLKEYNGYLYYAQDASIGRYDFVSTYTDTWKTAGVQSGYAHPMEISYGNLWFGNGQYVAKWDDTTFTSNALDIKTGWSVACLANYGLPYLAIGANFTSAIGSVKSKIFLWDRTSPTVWNNEIEIPENTIYSMISHSSGLWLLAGTTSVSIYHVPFGSFSAIKMHTFENDVSILYRPTVSMNAMAIKGNRIYFGLNTNTLSSTQTSPAIYSFIPQIQGFKIQGEYLSASITETNSTDVNYYCVRVVPTSTSPILYFSQVFSSTYQIVRDSSDINSPYSSTTSKVFSETVYYDAPAGKKLYFTGFGIDTLKRPAGTITLYYRKDGDTSWTSIVGHSTANSIGFYTTIPVECYTIQFKIEITSNSGRVPWYIKRLFATGKLTDDSR